MYPSPTSSSDCIIRSKFLPTEECRSFPYRHSEYVADGIGIRLVKPGQPIADECGKSLIKLPLRFCTYSVEHQGRFSRARDAGEDCDFSLRYTDIYIFRLFSRAPLIMISSMFIDSTSYFHFFSFHSITE